MVTSAPRPAQRVVVDCDVSELPADVVTVEALARFQLAARRHGSTLRVRNANPDLTELIAVLGLTDVLGS